MRINKLWLALFGFAGTLAGASYANGQAPGLYVWPPGPFELHYYWHGESRFDRRPYFAVNPPVYYSPGPKGRSFGWTPYPYPGLNYYQAAAPNGNRWATAQNYSHEVQARPQLRAQAGQKHRRSKQGLQLRQALRRKHQLLVSSR